MKKVLVTLSIFALSHNAIALEKMNDQDLASQTGQDGLTIKLGVSAVSFKQLALIDTNGMAGATNSAALIVAPTTSTDIVKVNFANSSGAPLVNLVTATIDADGGAAAGATFANINLAFSELKTIEVQPFAIYVAPTLSSTGAMGGTGSIFNGTALRSGVSKLLEIGNNTEKLTLNFKDSLGVNIQPGNPQQGHLIKLSGSLQSINIPKVKLFSKNTTSAVDSSIGFDAQLTATNATGINMVGFYGDIVNSGLVLGKDGTTDKFNLTLSNIVAGTTGSQSATSFNNLKNASIGTIGLVGASVTNLKMTVKGL